MVGRADGTIPPLTGDWFPRGSKALLNQSRAIIVLAPQKSHLQYIDIDTSHFSGNEAPSSSVLALRAEEIPSDEVKLNPNDSRWEEILPVVELGPDSRHVFELGAKAKEGIWSAVMVRMIPDGGMVSISPLVPQFQ
jgi:allantoicase